MDGIWTNEKSRLGVDTLNSLISVKCNADLKCVEIYNYFLNQKQLLKEAIRSEKYNC